MLGHNAIDLHTMYIYNCTFSYKVLYVIYGEINLTGQTQQDIPDRIYPTEYIQQDKPDRINPTGYTQQDKPNSIILKLIKYKIFSRTAANEKNNLFQTV